MAKPIPESAYQSGGTRKASSIDSRGNRVPWIARLGILLTLLAAAVALGWGVWTFLQQQPKTPGQTPSDQTTPTTTAPAVQAPPTTPPAAADAPPALPTPAPEQTELKQAPAPETPPAKAPAIEALAVLEKFLAAKNLDERLPLIESKTPADQLATSCLSAPLPPAANVVIDAQESSPAEQVVDFFYHVDFQPPGAPANPQTLLVRTRGTSPPKVVVDPFLDLFGGRLAAYAASPTDKGGQFQVIAYPIPNCMDPNLKDREKKMTLKLLARENTREVAQAYFSKLSKIGEMFTDGSHRLSYGKAKACTVLLRWNTEENPAYPYLEAIDIKTFDWNP